MQPSVSQDPQPQGHLSPKLRPTEHYPVKGPEQPEAPLLPQEAIAHRAYEKFLARASAHGADQEDWLLAERELMEELDEPKSLQTKPNQREERSDA